MSFPSAKTVLWHIAADPDAPTKARIAALTRLDRPSRQLLIAIMREKGVPAKLKAVASLLYADLMDARARKQKASKSAANTNALGLKS